jgi:hypothetical protein
MARLRGSRVTFEGYGEQFTCDSWEGGTILQMRRIPQKFRFEGIPRQALLGTAHGNVSPYLPCTWETSQD